MKRLIVIALLLALGATTAAAQDWKEALKRAATAAADKLTDGKLTEYALVGAWSYTAPGVKFEGEDLASELGGAALEATIVQRLEKGYRLVGIEPGACSFAFDREGGFTAQAGGRTLSGTYEFDPATHIVALHLSKGKYDLGTIPGHVYLAGAELQLVFPITKLVELVTALGSRVSALESAARLLRKYENVYVGFAFTRE